jgi:hypothetical protein
MDEDFEVEVTDLRTGRTLSHATSSPSASSPAVPAEDVPQRGPLGRTWQPGEAPSLGRARRLRAVVVAAAVLLATVLLLGSVPDSRAALATLLRLPTPAPTATLTQLANQFSAVNGVPWGVLRADGKVVSLYAAQSMFAFSLPRGRHTLEYRAEPFPVLRCVVSVPQAASDTCPLKTAADADVQLLEGAGRYLDFRCMLRALSDQQRVALEALIQPALDALQLTTVVPSGARYLGADGMPQVATAALAATFSYHLNFDQQQSRVAVGAESTDCVTLCGSFGASVWYVAAHDVMGWSFTSAGVAPLAVPALANQPPDAVIMAQVTWQNGWQMGGEPVAGRNVCDDIRGNAYALFISAANGSPVTVSAQAAANPADGCLFTVTPAGDSASTAPAPTSVYLYRFGILFTIDANAHNGAPELPVANADEQALARQLAPRPVG